VSKRLFHRLLFFILFWGAATAGYCSVAFVHYGTDDGLPESQIKIIAQDSIGFIWLASETSLIRFDGHHFKSYQNRTGRAPILPGNKINALYTDSKGVLWVGSENGIFHYDFLKDQFIGSFDGWNKIFVNDFAEDKHGRIFVATDEGLALFDPETKQTIWYTGSNQSKETEQEILPLGNIKLVTRQADGQLWLVPFDGGLYRFKPETREFENFTEVNGTQFDQITLTQIKYIENCLFISTLSNGFFEFNPEKQTVKNYTFGNQTYDIHHFSAEKNGTLWLASNSGLIRYNIHTQDYHRFINVPGDPLSLERTAVDFVILDRDKNLWTSSGIRGINYGINNVPFEHFVFSPDMGYTLFQKEVLAIHFDSENNMWLGYESGLVEKHDPITQTKSQYWIKSKSESGHTGAIFRIFEDSRRNIWIGGWQCGLQKFNRENNSFQQVSMQPGSISALLETADLRDITEDHGGNLWLSIHGKGIVRYNPSTGQAQQFHFSPIEQDFSLSNDFTFNSCVDQANRLWVATAHGVSKFNPESQQFTNYFRDDDNPLSLSSNTVQTIYCDQGGVIWAGTNNGLNVYHPEQDAFLPIANETTISSQNISSIESVKPGEIWISTKSGLFRLNYWWNDAQKFGYDLNYFNHSDGLISSNYFGRSSAVDSGRIIYFGGNEGVDFFNANASFQATGHTSKAIITETSVYGKSVFPHDAEDDPSLRELELDYNQQMISFRFTSLNFINPGKQKYRYQLEGFDQQWVVPQNEQVATYTRLSPGTYLFQVETTDRLGEWNGRPGSIRLIIHPPFWMTAPFIILSVMVVIGLFILIQRLRNRALLKRQFQLEMIIEERTRELQTKNQELEEANLTKNKFFSIISHDLKSPFSGLLGLLDLLSNADEQEFEQEKDLLKIANRSAKNIYNLLEKLLAWANSQSENFSCFPKENNLSEILRSNIGLSQEPASQKDIQIKHDLPDELTVFSDPDMIDTVIRNLLNNAIKFTKPEGTIEVTVEKMNDEVAVRIADSGIGMTPQQQKNLFKLGQNSREGTNGETGTGLGLLICKEFIAKNQGKIWTTPNQPTGTVFHFTLPAK
jgi:signal transduction histidine kinase/ligand-binding sensor domain-containing protein